MTTSLTQPPTNNGRPPPAPNGARIRKKRGILLRAIVGLTTIAAMAAGGAWLMHAAIDPVEDESRVSIAARHELLGNVRSWGYQLQNVNPAVAARSPHDLLVVDEDFVHSSSRTRRTDALRQLKQKPDSKRRLVLAYLSIGEAESYRSYWNKAWVTPAAVAPATTGLQPAPPSPSQPPGKAAAEVVASGRPLGGPKPLFAPTAVAPSWLGDENPDWRSNFHVRYWEEAWQRLLLGSETSALERIIAAGFDGVYLDRADAFQYWRKHRPGAKGDMTALIEQISERARSIAPGFIIVMQNAEELLGQGRLRSAIDAIAKEDLLFGVDGSENANSERDIAASIRYLKKAQTSGLPVFVVEYLSDAPRIDSARKRLGDLGFVPYFAPRALDRLTTTN